MYWREICKQSQVSGENKQRILMMLDPIQDIQGMKTRLRIKNQSFPLERNHSKSICTKMIKFIIEGKKREHKNSRRKDKKDSENSKKERHKFGRKSL
jgi:hypothetical protein